MRNTYLLIAGVLCLFISLLHTIGGHLSLVVPLLDSAIDSQVMVEWIGAFHMITLMLFYFSYVLIKSGLNYKPSDKGLMNMIGILSILFSVAFIGASLVQMKHAPQYILFLPMAVFCLMGIRSSNKKTEISTNN